MKLVILLLLVCTLAISVNGLSLTNGEKTSRPRCHCKARRHHRHHHHHHHHHHLRNNNKLGSSMDNNVFIDLGLEVSKCSGRNMHMPHDDENADDFYDKEIGADCEQISMLKKNKDSFKNVKIPDIPKKHCPTRSDEFGNSTNDESRFGNYWQLEKVTEIVTETASATKTFGKKMLKRQNSMSKQCVAVITKKMDYFDWAEKNPKRARALVALKSIGKGLKWKATELKNKTIAYMNVTKNFKTFVKDCKNLYTDLRDKGVVQAVKNRWPSIKFYIKAGFFIASAVLTSGVGQLIALGGGAAFKAIAGMIDTKWMENGACDNIASIVKITVRGAISVVNMFDIGKTLADVGAVFGTDAAKEWSSSGSMAGGAFKSLQNYINEESGNNEVVGTGLDAVFGNFEVGKKVFTKFGVNTVADVTTEDSVNAVAAKADEVHHHWLCSCNKKFHGKDFAGGSCKKVKTEKVRITWRCVDNGDPCSQQHLQDKVKLKDLKELDEANSPGEK